MVLAAVTSPVLAETPPRLEADATLTALAASADEADAETIASFDLRLAFSAGPGQWFVRAEASTTPKSSGVAAWFPEVNKDAGSALDGHGRGRVQLSEAYYEFAAGRGVWSVGLIDGPAYIDTSDIANDENRQFLAATFVNNPTLPLPDYSLGLAWRHPPGSRAGLTLLLQSSHGLADNDSGSYDDLVDLDADAKGVFAAAEVGFEWATSTLRLGAWGRKTSRPNDPGHAVPRNQAGIYGVIDGRAAAFNWNVRIGAADAGGSKPDTFVSMAADTSIGRGRLGAAAGRTASGAAYELPGRRAGWHLEVYYRHRLSDRFTLSPDIQYLHLAHPAGTGNQRVRNTLVAGVRITGAL